MLYWGCKKSALFIPCNINIVGAGALDRPAEETSSYRLAPGECEQLAPYRRGAPYGVEQAL